MLLILILLPGLLLAQQSGLAIVGGFPDYTAEFWTPAPKELHCSLPPLVLDRIGDASSVDLLEHTLVVCSGEGCDQLTPSGWQRWRNATEYRSWHTSAVTSQGLLLIGGKQKQIQKQTDLFPREGGETRNGFSLQHERDDGHCTITISLDTIILTGGGVTSGDASSLVTEYSDLGAGEEVTFRELPQTLQGRFAHACGWYSVGDSKMLLVTGGNSATGFSDTTEVFPYSIPGAGSWRQVGLLPSPRFGLFAAKLGDILYVTGGYDGPCCGDLDVSGLVDEILTWESGTETWSVAGHMKTARENHAVTEVSLAVVADYCSATNNN